jgi:hypothetical protein
MGHNIEWKILMNGKNVECNKRKMGPNVEWYIMTNGKNVEYNEQQMRLNWI